MIAPAIGNTRRVHTAAVANSRNASELSRIAAVGHPVAKPANRLDHVHGDLLAQSPDEHLDRIGIAIEILLVEVLDEPVRDTTRPLWCMR